MQGVTEPWVESVKESWLFSIQFMQWVHESFLECILFRLTMLHAPVYEGLGVFLLTSTGFWIAGKRDYFQ